MSDEYNRLLLIQYNQAQFSVRIEENLLSMLKESKAKTFDKELKGYKNLDKQLKQEYE